MPYDHTRILDSSNNNNNADCYCNNKYELELWLNLVWYNYRLPQ